MIVFLARLAVVWCAAVAVIACDAVAPSPSPTPSPARPAILLHQTWTALDGVWTFTGSVDPFGDPTDVVLEIGPGPATARQFDTRLPVAEDVVEPQSLEITTRDIPELDEICVRFAATNSGGTSASTPLCIPYAIPSFVPLSPTVQIDPTWTVAGDEWTFRGRVDPRGAPTDVVLEIGPGPASAGRFDIEVPVGQDMTDAATLTISTTEVPESGEVCVRFTAANELGSSSTSPLCFEPAAAASAGPSGAPGSSAP
jgi:hypothetical protein